ANGFEPKNDTGGSVAVFITFRDFQFITNGEELQLTHCSFDARIVPLLSSNAPDGHHLPDFIAISTGGAFPRYTLNARHLGENINYYKNELIVARMLAFGEVAAFARELKQVGVNLSELARRVDAVAPDELANARPRQWPLETRSKEA